MKNSYLLNTILLVLLTLTSCTTKQKAQGQNVQPINEPVKVQVKDISAETAIQIYDRNEQGIIFLDVRTPDEIADGFMTGALKIDYRNKEFKNQLLELDKRKSYVVYCKSGGRSSKASEIMVENGFTDVSNVLGGYSALSQLNKE